MMEGMLYRTESRDPKASEKYQVETSAQPVSVRNRKQDVKPATDKYSGVRTVNVSTPLIQAVKNKKRENLKPALPAEADVLDSDVYQVETSTQPVPVKNRKQDVKPAKDKYSGVHTDNASLIQAAKNKKRESLKLALLAGADVLDSDVDKKTALHFASLHGDDEAVKLLIAYKSSINKEDKKKHTPLDYALTNNHKSAADILLFCGAICQGENLPGRFKHLKRQSQALLDDIKSRNVIIECKELFRGTTTDFEKLELQITVPRDVTSTSVSFLCKRISPESFIDSLYPEGTETLISDAFQFITSKMDGKCIVALKIPVYGYPDPFEKIQMKTNNGVIDSPFSVFKSDAGISVEISLDIQNITSFILITIPKVESFPMGPKGGEFVSEVNKLVSINVAPNTFQNGSLKLKIIPPPEHAARNYKDIVSISHFYELNHSLGQNEFRRDGVTLTFPMPRDIEDEKDICVLSGDNQQYSDVSPEQNVHQMTWQILDDEPSIRNKKIIQKLSHFSIYVTGKKKRNLRNNEMKEQTNEIFEQAIKKSKIVHFFAVQKCMPNNRYKLILECEESKKSEINSERIMLWKEKGYTAMDPECTGDFISSENQMYDIRLSGNNLIKEFGTTTLQFISKRINYQELTIKPKTWNSGNIIHGVLDVHEMLKPKKLTSIPLWFTADIALEVMTEQCIIPHPRPQQLSAGDPRDARERRRESSARTVHTRHPNEHHFRPQSRQLQLYARDPRNARERRRESSAPRVPTRHTDGMVENLRRSHPQPQQLSARDARVARERRRESSQTDTLTVSRSRPRPKQLSARDARDARIARERRRESSSPRVSTRHTDDPLQEEDLRYIISELDDDWYQFGSNLNFSLRILSQIRNYRAEDDKNQEMLKLFQEWQIKSRNKYQDKGKGKLLNALWYIRRPDLARFVEEKFTYFHQ